MFVRRILKTHNLFICRQIVGLQVKDSDNGAKIRQLENKLSHAEAQNFRLQQKADERYGNTGCGFFKRGIQNYKGVWLKINFS